MERCTPARVLEWSEGVEGGLGDIVSTAADDDRKTLYSETGRGGESNLNGHGMWVTNGGRDDTMMGEVLILPPMQHTHTGCRWSCDSLVCGCRHAPHYICNMCSNVWSKADVRSPAHASNIWPRLRGSSRANTHGDELGDASRKRACPYSPVLGVLSAAGWSEGVEGGLGDMVTSAARLMSLGLALSAASSESPCRGVLCACNHDNNQPQFKICACI